MVQLVAREREVDEVVGRIGDGRRLVTIVGPGGIGKTRLARSVIDLLAPRYPKGAHVVELARIERADAVGGALAAQLGFSSFDVFLGSPMDEPTLLLVDNCEHVTDSAADAISTLLDVCRDVTVLATSRSPLAVSGESIVALGPLPVPGPGAIDPRVGAVLLFVERARDSGVSIAAGELELVGDLCRRLDGMPLAIELAAARLRVMGIGDILRRLGEGEEVLHRPRHRGSVRHRSIRDTIEWSVRLLDEESRAGFGWTGVCAGRFSLDLAVDVIGAPRQRGEEIVERLVDASLLVAERDVAATTFRVLEPIRAVALDHLEQRGELFVARERLASHVYGYVLSVMEEATRVWGPDLLPTLLDRFDQIDVAVRHCLDHDEDPIRAYVLYAVLWGVVHQARVDDVLALGELIMRRWPDVEAPHRADAVAAFAMGKFLCGHVEEAEAIATAALPHSAGSWAAAIGLRRVLALAARYRRDHRRAEALLEKAAGAAAEIGFVTMDLECQTYRAQDLAAMGRTDDALRIVRTVASDAAHGRSILNEIWARTVEGSVLSAAASGADELRRAQDVAVDALAASEAISYPFGISCNLQTITVCQLRAGARTEAAASAARLLDAFARSGSGDFRRALEIASAVLASAGHPAAGELGAVARRLPDTNPMVLQLELPEPIATGTRLDRAGATRLARSALAAVQVGESPAPDLRRQPNGPVTARFTRSGSMWELTFAGTTVQVVGSKGMDDLATLLGRPGHEFHCLELAGAAVEEPTTGEVIDATARRRYEARVRELQDEIDEAEQFNDRGRAERARTELDALVDHLTSALGLAGKVRTSGGTTERARSAVTHRIRSAAHRIGEAHPVLGRHFDRSISTGTYCSYQPETPIDWTL